MQKASRFFAPLGNNPRAEGIAWRDYTGHEIGMSRYNPISEPVVLSEGPSQRKSFVRRSAESIWSWKGNPGFSFLPIEVSAEKTLLTGSLRCGNLHHNFAESGRSAHSSSSAAIAGIIPSGMISPRPSSKPTSDKGMAIGPAFG